MKTTRPTTLLALAVLAAACAAETPPAVPSWDLDVFPILRGSCSHCHGVTAATGGTPFTRYDVCNAAAFSSVGLTRGPRRRQPPSGSTSATASARRGCRRRRRRPLSDYEATVLERWAKRPSCDKQVPNRKPIVRIIQPLTRSANSATVTIEVSDPDGDQVMGKVKLGTAPTPPATPSSSPVPGAGPSSSRTRAPTTGCRS